MFYFGFSEGICCGLCKKKKKGGDDIEMKKDPLGGHHKYKVRLMRSAKLFRVG